MARIHIDLPEAFMFAVDLPVRVADLNYGNHVGNDSILTIMQEARALFYRHLGFKSEVELDGSVGQVVADAAIVYRSESFFGDVLRVELSALRFHKFGFDMVYRLSNTLTNREVARGKTGIVSFDYAKRKMVPLPETIRRKIETAG